MSWNVRRDGRRRGGATLLALSLLSSWWIAPTEAQGQAGPDVPLRFRGTLRACERPGFPERALCGRHAVDEDRAPETSRRLTLDVVVLPATGEPATDAFTFLAGGGVLPATGMTPVFEQSLTKLNEARDVVLVDQRGTGRSGALECEAPDWQEVLAGDRSLEDYTEALEDCRDLLGRYTDLRAYTTLNAADDLDEIRRWLGYRALTIWGASYGTKVARVYARRHPDRVRALVLHGTVPLESSMWPHLGPSGVRALLALLDRCEKDEACRKTYPETERALERVLARLAEDRLKVERPEGELGPEHLNDRVVASVIVGGLGDRRTAEGIPRWIHAAARHDYSFFAALSASGPSEVPLGVYYSIACSEELGRPGGVPRADTNGIPASLGVFLEVSGLERDRQVCGLWPKARLPEGFWSLVTSDAPTLFVTGADDFITPPAYAEGVARGFSNATLLTPRDRGHNELDRCVVGIIEQFLIDPDADLDTSCVDGTPAFRFEPPDDEVG